MNVPLRDPASAPAHASGRLFPWALSGLSLSMLLASLGTSIANVALPTLTQTFGASFQAVQWVVVAYLVAVAASIVNVGRLGDVVGRRRLMRAGLLLFTGAALASGIAPTLWALVLARSIQGIGAAVMMTLAMAFVRDLVPKEKIGSAMGWLGTMSAVGTALGPSLGGLLIAALGWRSIFLLQLPLGLLASLLVHQFIPRDPPRARVVAFDAAGTSLLAATLVAYALAMTLGRGHFGVTSVVCLGVALVGGVLFVIVERRASSPILRSSMFRDPTLCAGLATNLLVSAVVMSTLVVGPFYLSLGLGLGAGSVGLVMSIGPLVAALTGIPAGRWVDRRGAGFTTLAGLGAVGLGCAALALTPASFGVGAYLASIVSITAGYALFQAANNSSILSDVPSGERGVVSGTLNLSRYLGLITGAAVMGAVFAFGTRAPDLTTAAPEAIAVGMRLTFGVATSVVLLALAIARLDLFWRSRGGAPDGSLHENHVSSVFALVLGRLLLFLGPGRHRGRGR